MDLSSRGFHICENGTKTVTIDGKQYKGEFVNGFYCFRKKRRGAFGQTITESDFDINYIVKEDGKSFEVIPETVGLYSGLPDTAGNNICLKDVIKYRPANSDSDKFLLVKWDEERATFKAGFATLWVIHDHCEVVGNIFENHELLQKIEQ